MRKLFELLSALALMLGAFGSGALAQQSPAADAEPERRTVLRFLTDSDYPPFNYIEEEGALTGLNVDLARAICLEVAATCDIAARPWDELFTALARGQADAVIAGHAISATALTRVEFTEPYFASAARFAGRRSAAKLDLSPDGLDGLRVAVAKGTAHEAYLDAYFRDARIQRFDGAELALEALQAGKVDLVFDDAVSLVFWTSGTQSRECCELKGGAFFDPKYFGDGIAIAVPKNDPQLKALLNGALRRVRASGRLEELMLRYFPQRVF